MPYSQDLKKLINKNKWVVSFAALIRIASFGMFLEVTGRFLAPEINWFSYIIMLIPVCWLVLHGIIIKDDRYEAKVTNRILQRFPEFQNKAGIIQHWEIMKDEIRIPLKPIKDAFWFFAACFFLAGLFYIARYFS